MHRDRTVAQTRADVSFLRNIGIAITLMVLLTGAVVANGLLQLGETEEEGLVALVPGIEILTPATNLMAGESLSANSQQSTE
jgi:hypothetical protein